MGREAHNSNSKESSVNYITKKAKKLPSRQRERTTCFCCGKPNHKASECRFKGYSCNTCGKKGHLAVICRDTKRTTETKKSNFKNYNKKQGRERQQFLVEENLTESFNNLFHLNSDSKVVGNKLITIEILVETKPVVFEIDSGSPISAISLGKLKEHKEKEHKELAKIEMRNAENF